MVTVLSTPVRLLVEAVARLADASPADLPGVVSLQDAAATLRAAEQLRAVSLRQLADVHTRELYALDGAPSATTWVAQQHTGTERSVVTLARRLAAVPHVEAAVLAGRLSVPGAARLAAALHTLRRHLDRLDGRIDGQDGQLVLPAVIVDGVLDLLCEARAGLPDDDPLLTRLRTQLTGIAGEPSSQTDQLEQALVVLAEHLEPALLPSALDRLVGALLPLQLQDRADRGHRDRSFVLRRLHDGSGWSATGQLDLECGELLHTVLTATRATDPDNPTDTAGRAAQRDLQEQPGVASGGAAGDRPDEASAPAPRSRRQQDHDALALGLRRLLDSGALGSRGKTAPHLLITVGLDTLHDAPGALPAVAASGTVLPAGLVRRWLCDSRLTRIVLSAGRRVLEISHTTRTLKAHERLAKHVECGGRCAGAGCPAPPGTPLVPHHPDPWHRTGTTSATDAVMVCEHTHHDIHEGARTIRLRDGRWLSPTGYVDGPYGRPHAVPDPPAPRPLD